MELLYFSIYFLLYVCTLGVENVFFEEPLSGGHDNQFLIPARVKSCSKYKKGVNGVRNQMGPIVKIDGMGKHALKEWDRNLENRGLEE